MAVNLFGGFAMIFFWLIGLAILYFIITLAVRHGIDNSEVGKIVREEAKSRKYKDNNNQI